jgi:short-subunit dehydrogenase
VPAAGLDWLPPRALASAGAHVTLNARDGSDLRTAAEAIRRRGGQAEIAVSDITDISAFSDYVRQSDPFDIFVNNAGMNGQSHSSKCARKNLTP